MTLTLAEAFLFRNSMYPNECIISKVNYQSNFFPPKNILAIIGVEKIGKSNFLTSGVCPVQVSLVMTWCEREVSSWSPVRCDSRPKALTGRLDVRGDALDDKGFY